MKTTIVPAQITTVEDKIAGNLTFTQLLLLITPVFIGGGIFALFPPLMGLTVLKLIIVSVIALAGVIMAIRIKGKILLMWGAIMVRYNLRPRYFVYNKNDAYQRNLATETLSEQPHDQQQDVTEPITVRPLFIPLPEVARLEMAVADPRANFHFTARKGGSRVHINEIKEESF